MNIKLTQKLFTCPKETIELLSSSSKTIVTSSLGPMGIGFSVARGSLRTAAKFSSVAKFLDLMFVNKAVSAICDNDVIYGEVSDGTNYHRFTCDGKQVVYEGERLHGNMFVIPLALYHLRNESTIDELKECFNAVRKGVDTGASQKELLTPVLQFCDAFYYAVAKPMTDDIIVTENALKMNEIQEKVRSGDFSPYSLFSGMVTPKFTGVDVNKSKKEKANRPSGDDFFSKIKAGEYDVNHEWTEKQRTRIPATSTLESFVPSSTYYSIVSKVKARMDNVALRMDAGKTGVDAIGKDYVNLFITGKPGTGKTTLAYALGAATNMPVYTIAMTKNTEEDVFQGMNKVVDGSLNFVSTDFLDAYQNGGIIILEEINLPDPSVVMGAIGQAVEFPFVLMKDGYMPVTRHPMCVIIGTMNIGTFGSKGVNQALSSRFRQSYILNDPSKDDFIKILTSGGAKKREANWVYSAYQKITDYLKSPTVNAEDVCLNVTLRGCFGALENIAEGEDPKEAIRNTLVGKISEVDLELAENVFKDVVQSLPELL